MKKLALAVVAVAALGAMVAQATVLPGTELVTNGSFEGGDTTKLNQNKVASFAYLPGGWSGGSGWAQKGAFVPVNPPDGSGAAYFQGATAAKQTIMFPVAGRYRVSFWYICRGTQSSSYPSLNLSACLGDRPLNEVVASSAAAWTQAVAEFDVKAPGPQLFQIKAFRGQTTQSDPGAAIDCVSVQLIDGPEGIVVNGEPDTRVPVDPAYGCIGDIEYGKAYVFTAPATHVNASATQASVCKGCIVETPGVSVVTTEQNSVTLTPVAGVELPNLTWLFENSNRVAAVSSDAALGTVTGPSGFHLEGTGGLVFTAEAAEGATFVGWAGDVPSGADLRSPTLTLAADRPRSVTAKFVDASSTWAGPVSGTAVFDDPENWGGSFPGEGGVIYIPAPTDSASALTIDVTNTFKVGDLIVGGTGAGKVTLNFKMGLSTNEVTRDVMVLGGATLTHEAHPNYTSAPRQAPTLYRLNLKVGGSMEVASGAFVNADEKGFYPGTGPNDRGSAAHGGLSSSGGTCYGSVFEPVTLGNGGNTTASYFSYGGGAIYLDVAGNLTLNGTLTANARNVHDGQAAGGSVFVKAAAVIGAGKVFACNCINAGNGVGGGGRIALYQRTATDWLQFTGTVTAKGQRCIVGTIYRECTAVDGPRGGTLTIDNANVNSWSDANKVLGIVPLPMADDGDAATAYADITVEILSGTLRLTGDVTFKSVVCRTVPGLSYTDKHKQWRKLDVGNHVLTLRGDLAVRASSTLTFGTTSGELAFDLAKGETASIVLPTGTTLPVKALTCVAPGATLAFGAGAGVTIFDSGALTLGGSAEDPLVLRSQIAGSRWTVAPGSDVDAKSIRYVDLSDSAVAGSTLAAYDSIGEEANNENWVFLDTPKSGELIVWTGEADSGWANGANWDRRRDPLDTDVVVIPAGCSNYPVIGKDVFVSTLTNLSGATITLDGGGLTVTNGFSNFGTFVQTAREELRFAGDGVQSVDLANKSYGWVTVAKDGGAVAFAHGFTAAKFDATATGAYAILFAAGETVAAEDFNVDGRPDLGNLVTLGSTVDGTAWLLDLTARQRIRGVNVKDSDASQGLVARPGALGADLNGNTSWDFAGSAMMEWTGAADTCWTNELNWSPAVVPTASSLVVVMPGAGETATVTVPENSPVSVENLRLGGAGGTVAFRADSPLTVGVDLEINAGATVELNAFLPGNVVSNDVIVRTGAVLTHTLNPSTVTTLDGVRYRLELDVLGDMTLEPSSAINVDEKGYYYKKYPANCAYAHGGSGTYANRCYGSVFEPVTLGSGGYYDLGTPSFATCGGGAVKLDIAGTFRHDGSITACSKDVHDGCGGGGSVFVKAASIVGAGKIWARSNWSAGNNVGGGGRIALYQRTATDWSAYTGEVITFGQYGSCGTIYRECTLADGPRGGTITLDSGTGITGGAYRGTVDLPMADDGNPRTAYANANLEIVRAMLRIVNHTSSWPQGSRMAVRDISIADPKTHITLNGNRIRVSDSAHRNGKDWADTYENLVTEGGGKIIWSTGLTVLVR